MPFAGHLGDLLKLATDATVRAEQSRRTVAQHRVLDVHATNFIGSMPGTHWLRRDATSGGELTGHHVAFRDAVFRDGGA